VKKYKKTGCAVYIILFKSLTTILLSSIGITTDFFVKVGNRQCCGKEAGQDDLLNFHVNSKRAEPLSWPLGD
jgi:hypothetical protein